MKRLFAICAFLMLPVVVDAHPLSSMEGGDRVEITFRSTGCFHNTVSYYEIKKSGGAVSFAEYAIAWSKEEPKFIVKKEVVGETGLDMEDISKLDQLMRFYRGSKEVFSTTQVELMVEYFEGDNRIKVERLRDGSGGHGLEERKGLITFHELSRRFKK